MNDAISDRFYRIVVIVDRWFINARRAVDPGPDPLPIGHGVW